MNEFTVDASIRHSPRRKDGTARRWALARKLIIGFSMAIACQTALAQAMYRIKPIGALSSCSHFFYPNVAGLNDADQVALTACTASGDSHAFLWSNNGNPMFDLGPNELGSESAAEGINASGQVGGAGKDSIGSFAFLASANGTPMQRIYNPFVGYSGNIHAYGINDLGQLTGQADVPYNPNTGVYSDAFLWRNDGSPMVDLGGALYEYYNAGLAINASGQVTGVGYDGQTSFTGGFVWLNNGTPLINLSPGGSFLINASGEVSGSGLFRAPGGGNIYQAFIWKPDGTPVKSLGTLTPRNVGQSYAHALNDSGQIVGTADTVSFSKPHAFIWMNDGSKRMKDIGTLGGTSSQANAVNASGQVTGWANLAGDSLAHAFLWRNDGTKIQDLNALIDPTDPLQPYITLTSGAFINKVGDIEATGTDSRTGQSSEYLLQGTVLTLGPRSLAFGNQPINTKSPAKSVTMTNTSPKAATISSIALTGTASGQFASTNNCGKSLAGHATCTIKVTFKPTTKGAKSEFLNVNGGGGGLRTVTLTGTGT